MKKTRITAYAIALCCSMTLVGCGTNESNDENELQQESKPSPGAQEAARMTDPNTPGAQSEEVEASTTNPGVGTMGHEMTPSRSIVENVSSNPNLSTLAALLRQANLVQDLSGTGPYTMLAPTNEAFDALPEGTLEDLVKPENKQRLVQILKNHVIAGKTSAADLQRGTTLMTMADTQLKVDKKMDDVMINGATIEQADVESKNGVIHIINKVLVPAEE